MTDRAGLKSSLTVGLTILRKAGNGTDAKPPFSTYERIEIILIDDELLQATV